MQHRQPRRLSKQLYSSHEVDYDKGEFLALVFLQEVSSPRYGRVRLKAGARDRRLQEHVSAPGNRIAIAERGEKRLMP